MVSEDNFFDPIKGSCVVICDRLTNCCKNFHILFKTKKLTLSGKRFYEILLPTAICI